MPKLIDVDVTRAMNVPPDKVWAVLADLNRLPEWLAFASAVTDVSGPAQVGARYTVKPHKSYEPTTHWTITEVDQPVRQVHTSEMPVVRGVRSELQIEPSADGASVRAHWTGTPKGVLGKMMSGMMQKRIAENWERSLQALERIAGSEAATPTSP
jgi:uncharacterized protein YndB with AHSA1/START domain